MFSPVLTQAKVFLTAVYASEESSHPFMKRSSYDDKYQLSTEPGFLY